MYVEGQHQDPEGLDEYLEFRLDGPRIVELSKDYFRIECEINILAHLIKNDTDFHRIHRVCGIVTAAFVDIPLYRYGDDDSLFGCMTRIDNPGYNRDNALIVAQFGQIDPTQKIEQATVEGHYRCFLEGVSNVLASGSSTN